MNNIISLLSAILKFAVVHRIIEPNSCASLKRVKRQERQPTFWTMEETDRFLRYCGEDWVLFQFHGSSMVTRDLDLCFVLSPENIEKLRSSLRDLNPKLRITPQKLSFLDYPESTNGLKNLYLQTDLGIVEIVSSVTGVGDFTTVLGDADTVPLFGHEVKVISRAHLIASKRAIGQPKDLAVVKELEEIDR